MPNRIAHHTNIVAVAGGLDFISREPLTVELGSVQHFFRVRPIPFFQVMIAGIGIHFDGSSP